MCPEKYWPERSASKKAKKNTDDSVSTATTATSQGLRARSSKRRLSDDDTFLSSSSKIVRCTRITDLSIDPRSGDLRIRLSFGPGQHCPDPAVTKNAQCGLHNWAMKETEHQVKRGGLMYCETCNVHLCLPCWKKFHTIQEVKDVSDAVKKEHSKKRVVALGGKRYEEDEMKQI